MGLAQWIANAENPLTARVAVNHLWARHFGKGLVPTVAEFGVNGKKPSHPELLDWLAVELVESGWSMKKLHRLMVMSSAYKRRSTAGPGENRSVFESGERDFAADESAADGIGSGAR